MHAALDFTHCAKVVDQATVAIDDPSLVIILDVNLKPNSEEQLIDAGLDVREHHASDLSPHECGGFLIQRRHADKTEVLSGGVSSTGITSARSGPSFTEDGFAFFVRRSFFLVFGL